MLLFDLLPTLQLGKYFDVKIKHWVRIFLRNWTYFDTYLNEKSMLRIDKQRVKKGHQTEFHTDFKSNSTKIIKN